MNTESEIEAVCAFVMAYEKQKYIIMHKGGKLLGVNCFMVDYCQKLRARSKTEATNHARK